MAHDVYTLLIVCWYRDLRGHKKTVRNNTNTTEKTFEDSPFSHAAAGCRSILAMLTSVMMPNDVYIPVPLASLLRRSKATCTYRYKAILVLKYLDFNTKLSWVGRHYYHTNTVPSDLDLTHSYLCRSTQDNHQCNWAVWCKSVRLLSIHSLESATP